VPRRDVCWTVGVDGVHDLGGSTSFGPVIRDGDEPVFAAPWEGRVFGLVGFAVRAAGQGTPAFRHAIERMDGVHYLTSPYYEHWLTAIATLVVEHGVVDADELDRRSGDGGFPLSRPVAPEPVPPSLAGPAPDTARFAPGQPVRVRNVHPLGHTRCPGYVRGRMGEVIRVDAPAPVPELEAHGGERVLEPVYAVSFTLAELWGDGAEPGVTVIVDLHDRYLDPAGSGGTST
jgi:nitrile hydratase subunit beta